MRRPFMQVIGSTVVMMHISLDCVALNHVHHSSVNSGPQGIRLLSTYTIAECKKKQHSSVSIEHPKIWCILLDCFTIILQSIQPPEKSQKWHAFQISIPIY